MIKKQLQIAIDRSRVVDFCTRWGVVELSFFGSVLSESFSATSDIDVLIEFAPGVRRTLFDFAAMREELKILFGREVDLVTRSSIESSRNWIRRNAILSGSERYYAKGA